MTAPLAAGHPVTSTVLQTQRAMAATIPTELHFTDLVYPLWRVIDGLLIAVFVFMAAILSTLVFTVKTILVLLQIVSPPVSGYSIRFFSSSRCS
jgi:hypothetical protein